MKKVYATVIYNNITNTIYSLTAMKANGDLLRFVSTNNTMYNDFRQMYIAVLTVLRNNGFYVGKHDEFNARCYDIQWIDITELKPDIYFIPKEAERRK